MGLFVAAVQILGLFASTIWALQERRFAVVYDTAVRFVMDSVMICLRAVER